MDSAHVSEMLHSRHITFSGKFEPVQHKCRALRPNGSLCERQDRLKVSKASRQGHGHDAVPTQGGAGPRLVALEVLALFASILDQGYL